MLDVECRENNHSAKDQLRNALRKEKKLSEICEEFLF